MAGNPALAGFAAMIPKVLDVIKGGQKETIVCESSKM